MSRSHEHVKARELGGSKCGPALRGRSRSAFASQLRAMGIVVTSACNLDCTYCPSASAKKQHIDWDVARQGLDHALTDRGYPRDLVFHGGEPLLVLQLLERCITYIKSRCPPLRAPRISLSTNGTLLDEKTIAFLERNRIALGISLDGIEAAQRLRAPGTFYRLMEVLSLLRNDHPEFFEKHVSIRMTLTSENLPHLAASYRFLVREGIRCIELHPLITHDRTWGPSSSALLEQQLTEISRLALDHYIRHGEQPFVPLHKRRRRSNTGVQPMCGETPATSCVVDTDGSILRCIGCAPSIQRDLSWAPFTLARPGRIQDGRLGEVLEAIAAQTQNDRLFHSRDKKRTETRYCSSCQFFDECLVCPLSIAHIPGNPNPDLVPESQCAYNRATARARRWFWRNVYTTPISFEDTSASRGPP